MEQVNSLKIKKILFINSKQVQCGVYQYGLRLSNILKKSKKIDFFYVELQDPNEFFNLNLNNFEIILFNFIEGGLYYWLNNSTVQIIKQINPNIKLSTILHTPNLCGINFDFIIDQNPNTNNGIPRPLFDYNICEYNNNNKINIGSFGFGEPRKGFDHIVKIVNQQFHEAIINLNITNSYFGDRDSVLTNNLVNDIINIPIKKEIILNINRSFLQNNQIINFLRQNDINMFLYRDSKGISSVIDYAIYANKPIAITNDECFKHIYNENIDIDKRSIKDIILFCNKEKYVQKIKHNWSEINLIDKFEKLVYNI
jgi:hypothetical protein